MTEKTRFILRMSGVGAVALALLISIAWGKKQTPQNVPCAAVEYDFQDIAQRAYVTSAELDVLLEKENLYPLGKPLSGIALQRMEQTINQHPMVQHAECFVTPRNKVIIQLTQRAPLLRVQKAGETYFIDNHRRKMEARPSVKDSVLVVKGSVSEELASTALADFAIWLRGNSYWKKKIHYVDVKTPKMVHLHLKGTKQPCIILGELKGFQSKLAKLRTFFEKGADATQDKNYTELDLRFKDQVIGRK